MTRKQILDTYAPPCDLTTIDVRELEELFLEIDGVDNPFAERAYVSGIFSKSDYEIEERVRLLKQAVKSEIERRKSTDNNTPEFCGLFKGLPEQNKAQLFAQELGLVNQSGKWALGERGAKWKIPIFWKLVNDHGLTHWRDDRVEPCQIIAKNWATTVSKSACYDTTGKGKAAFTEKAKDVLKRLLAD